MRSSGEQAHVGSLSPGIVEQVIISFNGTLRTVNAKGTDGMLNPDVLFTSLLGWGRNG